MKTKGPIIGILAVAATVVLSVLRIAVLPKMIDGRVSNGVTVGLLLAVSAALLSLFLACGGKKTAMTLQGKRLTVVSMGAMFTGVSMVASAIISFIDWKATGLLPYPANLHPTNLDITLWQLMVVFGVLGGVFFFGLSLRWQLKGQTSSAVLRLLALAPLVWSWVRVARYEMSYISSVHVFHHAYDLLLMVSEMLFFLWFDRYVAALEDTPPRFLTGISLCTGVLGAAACITRVAMVIMGNKAAFDACGLVTAADLGVAVLAFSLAIGHLTEKTEPVSEPAPPPEVPRYTITRDDMLLSQLMPDMEGDEAAYLLDFSSEFITEGDDEDVPENHGPLELEDVIGDIISRIENGEK